MNENDILNMPAGREMDALVAEKVMGWRRDTYYIQVGTTESKTREGLFGPAGIRLVDQYPEYSTDIAAAWDVVERMGAEKDYSIIHIHLVSSQRESSLKLDYRKSRQWSVDFQGSGLLTGYAEIAPLAICRAALLVTLEIP